MKTLHLSIIAIMGIIIIVMTSVGVFMKKLDDNTGPLYTGMMITGVKENYTLNEPIAFSVMVDGYGSGCGDTKAILTKENDSQYKSQVWDAGRQCASFSNPTNFEFKGLSANTTINQVGNYAITASFDDSVTYRHTIAEEKFSVTGSKIMSIFDNGTTSHSTQDVLENNCEKFYTVPESKSDFNAIPVLVLKQNSTGCAKITFTVNLPFNNTNDCIGCNSQMVKTAEFLSIGKYNFSRHGNLLSGSPGKDYTNSFQITVVPKIVNIANLPVGSNFTVMFTIKPLPNATGFYDYSIVKPVCNAYPLAVGYSPDQVNSSDFSEGLGFMQNHTCAMGLYGYSSVQISGINYVQMKLD